MKNVYPAMRDFWKGVSAAACGLAAALAMTVPATAYQFESPDPSAVPAELTSSSVSSGCHRTVRTGVYNLNTPDGLKRTRTFTVQVPAQYNWGKAYPVIFVFHGAGGNASQAYSWGLQNAPGASEEAIFVFPDGVAYKNYGVGWDDTKAGYDMPFFDNMKTYLEGSFCINTARIFAAGFSWGGDFVTALTCTRGNVVRAAVVNSASDEYNNNTNYLTYQNLPCPNNTHPAVRFSHAAGGDSAYPAPNFATTSKLMQHFNTCSTTATKVPASFSGMSCESYNSCGKEYVECTFSASIGHQLPPNWAKDTWAFFQTFN